MVLVKYWPEQRRRRFLFLWRTSYRDSEDIRAEINRIPAPFPVKSKWMMWIMAWHCGVTRPRSIMSIDWERRKMRARGFADPDSTWAVKNAIQKAKIADAQAPRPKRRGARNASPPLPKKSPAIRTHSPGLSMGAPPKRARLAKPAPKHKGRIKSGRKQ